MFGIIANVMTDHALRTGAKVFVVAQESGMGRVEVRGLCKRGRMITKHMAWKRLTNFRPAFLPPGMEEHCRVWWDDREAATRVAIELTEIWRFVRSFHPDGRLLNDGISEGQAIQEYLAKRDLPKFHRVGPILPIDERLTELRKAGLYYARDVKKVAVQVPVGD